MTHAPVLVKAEQAASFFGIPVDWFYTKAQRHEIPSYKIGKYRRFSIEDLESFFAQHPTTNS